MPPTKKTNEPKTQLRPNYFVVRPIDENDEELRLVIVATTLADARERTKALLENSKYEDTLIILQTIEKHELKLHRQINTQTI